MPEHLTPQPAGDAEPHTVTLPLEEWHALLRLLIGKAPIYSASERSRFVAAIATQLAAPDGGSTASVPSEDTHAPS
jgi:hypothetical protein